MNEHVASSDPVAAAGTEYAVLRDLLAGRWGLVKEQTRDVMSDPQFWRDYSLGLDGHRARVLEQLKAFAQTGIPQRGFPVAYGGLGDAGAGVVGFEDLVLGDTSMQVKSGVQWGLFGGAILHLGTQRHHDAYLASAMALDTPGVFAMTEVGHGSNVAGLRTTATYDRERDVFDLHTPDRGAWKDYLGNAALHGRAAVVFAQLIVDGECHGVHAFYVPIRDGNGQLLAGISCEDDGVKGGLNGIDNGRLCFTHVQVPRADLLDRYGHVDEDGVYSSPIKSSGRRFFTMISTLVQGRVFLVGASRAACQAGLSIATRYALARRQFAMTHGGEETRLLDYAEHQRRLLPRIAGTYGLTFLSEDLVSVFDEVFSPMVSGGPSKPVDERAQSDLETLAATVKPWATWFALDLLQGCREACGGAGFLAENRLTGMRADLDIFVTFEGDNTVLLQLAARRLIDVYVRDVRERGSAGVAGVAAGRVKEMAVYRSGLARIGQGLADVFRSRDRVGAAVLERRVQERLLKDRVSVQTAHLVRVLAPARGLPEEEAAAVVNRHQHGLVELGRAYGDLLVWKAFQKRIDELETTEDQALMGAVAVLKQLRDLFVAGVVERNAGWFAAYGRVSARRLRAVTAHVDGVLLPALRPKAGMLVDAFGLSDDLLRVPILD